MRPILTKLLLRTQLVWECLPELDGIEKQALKGVELSWPLELAMLFVSSVSSLTLSPEVTLSLGLLVLDVTIVFYETVTIERK